MTPTSRNKRHARAPRDALARDLSQQADVDGRPHLQSQTSAQRPNRRRYTAAPAAACTATARRVLARLTRSPEPTRPPRLRRGVPCRLSRLDASHRTDAATAPPASRLRVRQRPRWPTPPTPSRRRRRSCRNRRRRRHAPPLGYPRRRPPARTTRTRAAAAAAGGPAARRPQERQRRRCRRRRRRGGARRSSSEPPPPPPPRLSITKAEKAPPTEEFAASPAGSDLPLPLLSYGYSADDARRLWAADCLTTCSTRSRTAGSGRPSTRRARRDRRRPARRRFAKGVRSVAARLGVDVQTRRRPAR